MTEKRKRGKGKAVDEKFNNIMNYLNKNPYLTITELAEKTGYPRATVCRILKTRGENKKDIRKRENLIENLKRGGII